MSTIKNQDEWMCSCDIEIVFLGTVLSEMQESLKSAPKTGCVIEDKNESGWGVVIARDSCWEGDRRDISQLVIDYLDSLKTVLSGSLRGHNDTLLRIGIYHSSFNFTFSLSHEAIVLLNELSLKLEISLYPSE